MRLRPISRPPIFPFLLLTAVPLTGCTLGDGAERAGLATAAADRPAIPVAAVEVRRRDLTRTVTLSGPVEPIHTVLVSAQMSGTALSVRVEEGDRVRAGQILAELDARETAVQLERARAQLANAESAYRRTEQLADAGLVTDAELEAVRSNWKIARADVEVWETRLAFSRIAAPAAGVITARHVEQGAAVAPNQTLFEIAQDSQLVVRVPVSELDVVHLQPGDTVSVGLDAYPGATIPSRIRRVFPGADPDSRLVPVEVALGPRPEGVEVRPGFLARVELYFDERQDALSVPARAIGTLASGPYVYVIQSDTLVRRPVRTGPTADGWVEVADGLYPGEWVVSSGQTNLRPGARVRVTETLDETVSDLETGR